MRSGLGAVWLPVTILFGLLALAYVGMWRGWRRRALRHDLPPLVAVPEEAAGTGALEAEGRYFGTTVAGSWLDRVVTRGLGTRSGCRITLSADGLDVVRPADSFRVVRAALRGARHDQGIAGKVVPPHGLLVVTWAHGDLLLDSGFRVDAPSTTEVHDTWVRSINRIVEENAA